MAMRLAFPLCWARAAPMAEKVNRPRIRSRRLIRSTLSAINISVPRRGHIYYHRLDSQSVRSFTERDGDPTISHLVMSADTHLLILLGRTPVRTPNHLLDG
jgi:hypothetical protein